MKRYLRNGGGAVQILTKDRRMVLALIGDLKNIWRVGNQSFVLTNGLLKASWHILEISFN